MPVIEVELWAFRDAGKIRKVTIPPGGTLDTVWHYGQNDFQPQPGLRSVSCGDVIRWHGRRFMVVSAGFKMIEKDFIPDTNVVSPSDAVINLNLKEQTDQVLRTLTPREERVIKMRFGVGEGSEHTLEEVGQSFAVTRERIRQIEAKALRKLRHPSRSRRLKPFLEGR